MGIKTVINEKGVVSTKVQGSDQFVVGTRSAQTVTVVSASGDHTLSDAAVAVFDASGNAVTASLPVIGAGNVGLQYTAINTATAFALVLSGATGQRINGGSLEFEVSASYGFNTAQGIISANSGSGYGWFTL